MFGHLPELFIVLVIALIVFGPEKLPEMAANAGKMMREVRQVMDMAMNPIEQASDDFSTYYYESLARAGEDVPPAEEMYHSASDEEEEEEEEYLLRPDRPGFQTETHFTESDPTPPVARTVHEESLYSSTSNGNKPESSPTND